MNNIVGYAFEPLGDNVNLELNDDDDNDNNMPNADCTATRQIS